MDHPSGVFGLKIALGPELPNLNYVNLKSRGTSVPCGALDVLRRHNWSVLGTSDF